MKETAAKFGISRALKVRSNEDGIGQKEKVSCTRLGSSAFSLLL